jgi:UDP-2,3-diacylglucosamine pyrophosphatase LpxH
MCNYKEEGRKLIFWGDNHWTFNYIREELDKDRLTDTVLIQVGDFGVGFKHIEKEKSVLRHLNLLLIEKNVTLYVLRGNHDNPKYYNNKQLNLSNIILLEDYSILCINEHKVLTIGGAVSIDQIHRIPGKSWWVGEKVVYSDIVKELTGITIVASHTIPGEVPPPLDMKVPILEHYGLLQPWLEYELRDERELMTKIYAELQENNNIEKWYYGHYHRSFLSEINGTTFYGLNINEFSRPI